MMTIVLSSEGNVTDSHSDDPDGSNHCFAGRKLWLAWDTFEGRACGLEDVERDRIRRTARFDLRTFLSLPSSRWFVVSPNQTLFLPGHLTHKVVTLEHYLGVGSFYVAIPNSVRTIARWMIHGPLWSLEDSRGEHAHLVSDVARHTLARIRRARALPLAARARSGLSFLRYSRARWEHSVDQAVRARLLRQPVFAALLDEAARE